MLMYSKFLLEDKDDVIRLNREATKANCKINVSSDQIVIDARSLLALFALIGREVNLVAPDHANPDDFINFVKRISK